MKNLLAVLAVAVLGFQDRTAAQVLTASNLPILSIKTGISADVILDEPKIDARMHLLEPGPGGLTALADTSLMPFQRIGIERRGTSSQDAYPKVGYAIETRDSTGKAEDISPLGFPAENDWVLVGPYNDKSLMRDAMAYATASLSMAYAPRASFVELVIDNDYQGVYLFLEKIKRGKDRVGVSKLKPTDTTGDQLTGGYILKLDKPTGQTIGGWQSSFEPFPGATQRSYLQYHYPKPESIVPEQQVYIQQFILDFETTLAGPNFDHPTDGYAKYIDVDSWVDYLLVNEVTKNLDAYRLSTFMFKDRDSLDGRLHMGPVWDFNIAFGIGDYCEAGPPQGWAFDFNNQCPWDAWVIPFWWNKLLSDPAFKQKMAARWQFLRKNQWTNQSLFGKIDSMEVLLKEPQKRNFQRWPVLGQYVWPNYFIGQSWSAEVGYLRSWLAQRLAWMDGAVAGLVAVDTSYALINAVSPTPNPASGSTFFEYRTAVLADVSLELFDAAGRRIEHFEKLPTGKNARFELPLPAEMGLYFYRFKVDGKPVASGKILATP